MYHSEVNPENKIVFSLLNILIHELVILASSPIPNLLRTKALGSTSELHSCQLERHSPDVGAQRRWTTVIITASITPFRIYNKLTAIISTFSIKFSSGSKWSSAMDGCTICSKFTVLFLGELAPKDKSQIKSRKPETLFVLIWREYQNP